MIVFRCDKCGHQQPIDDSFAGKRVRCPKCKETMDLPLSLSGNGDSVQPAEPLGQVGNHPQAAPASGSDSKSCPYCGEQIKLVAIVCRYCGMNLQTGTSTKVQSPVASVAKKSNPVSEPAMTVWSGTPSHVTYFGLYGLGGVFALVGIGMCLAGAPVGAATAMLFLGAIVICWAALDRACTLYTLTNQKVTCKKGILGKSLSEVDLKDIRNIVINYGIVERMFRVGTVEVAAATARTFEVRFLGIDSPDEVKELISQAKEELLS